MNNRYLDWLYIMGLHDTLAFINNQRYFLYNNVDKDINVKKVILYDFSKDRLKRT